MILAIGSDHRGFDLKTHLIQVFHEHQWLDVGAFDAQRTDFPKFAFGVCQELMGGSAERGILICGSGVGMSIAANRVRGIYAALCWNVDVARLACAHDGANVLVLPSDFVSPEQAVEMIKAWLGATFLGGRYQDRLESIDQACEGICEGKKG